MRTIRTRGQDPGGRSQKGNRAVRNGRGSGQRAQWQRLGYGQAKQLPVVGYVSVYRKLYGGQGARQEAVCLIYFGTYNIQKGRNGELESALERMLQTNVDLGVLQEKKVTKGINMQESIVYQFVVSEAPRAHSRSVTVLFREADHLFEEVIHIYGANVVRFKHRLASGGISWGSIFSQTMPRP